MKAQVYEVPLNYYAQMTVQASLPGDLLNLQKNWFIQRCFKELDLDTAAAFVPQLVLDRLLQHQLRDEGDLREFVFSARNIDPGAKINMALVPRGTDIPDQRLTANYPGETFFMDVHTGGYPGKSTRHEFRRTGIDLLTGDHIYREQEEA